MRLSYIDIHDGQRHETEEMSVVNIDVTSWVLMGYQIIRATPDEMDMLCNLFAASLRELVFDRSAAASTLGRSTSERKATAARENGRKGGRPRKQ